MSYPQYLWEYPAENAAQSVKDQFGQTWARPVIAKVRVEIAGSYRSDEIALAVAGERVVVESSRRPPIKATVRI